MSISRAKGLNSIEFKVDFSFCLDILSSKKVELERHALLTSASYGGKMPGLRSGRFSLIV